MPTYEYLCKSCGNLWEEVQRITESPRTECPKCLKATAERQLSGGTFILKGGGWYADAYSSKPSGGEAKTDKAEKTETKAETKTETKAETKTETKTATSPAPATTPTKTD